VDLIGTAGEDDCHAVVNVVSIISHCYLTDSDPYWRLSKGDTVRGILCLPLTSRMEFFGPVGSWPGEYPRSLIVIRAILSDCEVVLKGNCYKNVG
jgi:hypothetical protein